MSPGALLSKYTSTYFRAVLTVASALVLSVPLLVVAAGGSVLSVFAAFVALVRCGDANSQDAVARFLMRLLQWHVQVLSICSWLRGRRRDYIQVLHDLGNPHASMMTHIDVIDNILLVHAIKSGQPVGDDVEEFYVALGAHHQSQQQLGAEDGGALQQRNVVADRPPLGGCPFPAPVFERFGHERHTSLPQLLAVTIIMCPIFVVIFAAASAMLIGVLAYSFFAGLACGLLAPHLFAMTPMAIGYALLALIESVLPPMQPVPRDVLLQGTAAATASRTMTFISS
eukprot:TRINITY_DN85688_c0_g1_i1.p1 TRINITY_DN85688_c0_g1~~TRINITY_DN85688_c0_g1_i1.p1  ORF type:complete len:299 (-),score=107.93 TRINITY_DN85688_c0_g1_i1:23-874(-)